MLHWASDLDDALGRPTLRRTGMAFETRNARSFCSADLLETVSSKLEKKNKKLDPVAVQEVR
jgi:hypothetical protein